MNIIHYLTGADGIRSVDVGPGYRVYFCLLPNT